MPINIDNCKNFVLSKNLTDKINVTKSKHYQLEDNVEIINIREIPRDYAKLEIAKYMQDAGNRKVYVSEIVEELCLDIELVKNIVEEIRNEKYEL